LKINLKNGGAVMNHWWAKNWSRLVFLMAITALAIAPGLQDASFAQGKPFYQGKVIQLIVCTKPGGGFDTDARLIAPSLEAQLPGSTIITRNIPGGGHIVGANKVWHSRPNGRIIGVANIPGLLASQIRGAKGVEFDLKQFVWLGRLYTRSRFLFARKNAGFDDIESLLKGNKEFKIGVSGIGSGPYNTGLLVAEALGIKNIRMIPGYGGREEATAMMRKEIEGVIGGLESWTEMIKQGEVAPILAFDLKRHRAYGQVPTLSELVKGDFSKKIAEYIAAEAELSRAIFAPPKLPDNVTETLRQALLKALASQEFKQKIAKMKRDEFDPLPGDEVAKMVASALDVPPKLKETLIELARKRR